MDELAVNRTQDGRHGIVMTGDVILDVPDPGHWLGGIAPRLQAAKLAIGHLEVPHTDRGIEKGDDVPAPAADPEALAALRVAGYDVMTLAGNHIADQGAAGIEDSLAGLRKNGIAACGAGGDLDEARRPALVDLDGHTVAVLSYNCVGPESSWATRDRAGCAYLKMETDDGGPVSPTVALVRVSDEARSILEADIRAVRPEADLVIVALHKGIVHTPVTLASYERPVSRLAIDSGADIVIGHHAHIVKGIEVYRGKPIFHGLGNGCVVTRALSPDQDHAGRAEWARRRKELFGFEPDPAYELAPFHPEAVNAMLARVSWGGGQPLRFGIVPVHVEPPGRPVPAHGDRALEIVAYVERITREAGLPAVSFEEQDDMWVVRS